MRHEVWCEVWECGLLVGPVGLGAGPDGTGRHRTMGYDNVNPPTRGLVGNNIYIYMYIQ